MTLRVPYLFLLLALLAVALVAPSTIFPFIGIKAYWFRTCVGLAFLAFLFWFGFRANDEEVRERFRYAFSSPLVLAVTAFVAVFLLASLFAYDPALAFWSNFERGEGGFAMLFYYFFFLMLVLIARDKEAWRMLFSVALIAAVLVVGYGLLAAFAPAGASQYFLGPRGLSGILGQRFAGSLGNPSYAGSYFLFCIFFAGFLLTDGRTVRWQRAILWGLIAFFFAFFLVTATRGAILGLGSGAFFALCIYAWKTPPWRRQIIGGLIALILLGGSVVYFRNALFPRTVPVLSRITRFSLADRSVETRVWVWEAAWKGWRERPLLGWGPENFGTVFDRHFDTRHYVPGVPSDTWYDRAHNVIFDYLVETGALGLTAFLSIFAAFYGVLFRGWTRLRTVYSAAFLSLLAAFPAAYLAQGAVLFDVLPTYLSLFLFLAFAAYLFNISISQINSPHS